MVPSAYSLTGELCEECHVIDRDGAQWLVLFVERGERKHVRRFDSEDAAYREFLRRVLMDRGTRIPPPPPGTPPVQPRR